VRHVGVVRGLRMEKFPFREIMRTRNHTLATLDASGAVRGRKSVELWVVPWEGNQRGPV